MLSHPPPASRRGWRAWRRLGRRRESLGWNLFRNLLLLVLVLGGGVWVTGRLSDEQAVGSLARAVIAKCQEETLLELGRFLDPVDSLLHAAELYGASGLMAPENTDAMNRLVMPWLVEYPQISTVVTGDARGNAYMLTRGSNGWVNRIVNRQAWGSRTFWQEWSPDFDFQREYWREYDYDPRLRPWFLEAARLGPGKVAWTAPYRFYASGEPGITASIQVQAGEEEQEQVIVGLDILLEGITRFTRLREVSQRGLAVVVTDDGRLLGVPAVEGRDARLDFEAELLRPVAALGNPVLTAAWGIWARARGDMDNPAPFAFHAGEEAWWAGFRPYRLGSGRALWVGVAVPESDFLGPFQRQQQMVVALTGGAVLLAGWLAFVLAREYGRPLRALAAASERFADLDFERPVRVETRLREVAALAESHDKLRGVLDAFSRYAPVDVVRHLLRQGEAASIGSRREVLTVMFADIDGFAAVAGEVPPDAMSRHLSEYFSIMAGEVRRARGTVDQFTGDAVMAFWGAPHRDPAHARRALDALIEMRSALERANARWQAEGRPALSARFGLATGEAAVGSVGAPERMNYTALGAAVSLSRGLQDLNARYGTAALVAETTRAAAGGDEHYVWREVDRVLVKGASQPVTLYELLGRRGEVAADVSHEHSRAETQGRGEEKFRRENHPPLSVSASLRASSE